VTHDGLSLLYVRDFAEGSAGKRSFSQSPAFALADSVPLQRQCSRFDAAIDARVPPLREIRNRTPPSREWWAHDVLGWGASALGMDGSNAFVHWVECNDPWNVEEYTISRLPLPLNIDQNEHHCFCASLRKMRSVAGDKARLLPVLAK
jgi:hypothetical protein